MSCRTVAVEAITTSPPQTTQVSSEQACGPQYSSGVLQLPPANTYQLVVTANDNVVGTVSANVGSR